MRRNSSDGELYSEVVDRDHEEYQYLDLMNTLIHYGEVKENRTGIPTRSLFGNMMRFSLTDLKTGKPTIPLLTTKKVFYRGIVEELLWFISGSTDAKILDAKGVKIWNPNSASRDGDCGPIYGFQMCHFGAEYVDCNTDYAGQGVNQIHAVIESLIKDPTSRRHIISNWNPGQLNQMCLAPCHILSHFNVSRPDGIGPGRLECLIYQRSADVPLGVPFNIASYATLTHMIAQQTGLVAKSLVYMTGDTHIYENQIEPAREQLKRDPRPWPILRLNAVKTIDSYTWEDFILEKYNPHPAIHYEFAV
jgi:thymidylate synthase